MDNIQLYQHIRLDTGEIFYIGIGQPGRAERRGRNKYWNNIVNKAGYRVVVIEDCLTWEQACEIEIMLIAHYGRRDLGKGPLVNLTNGGDGSFGYKHTSEAITKISAARKGRPRTAETTAEWRAKMSAAMKGRTRPPRSTEWSAKLSAAQKGRTASPETRAKLREAWVRRKAAKNN
jgi:hypothetical protein